MMASTTKFESLPDEILMIIFQYLNNPYETFKIFIGLNIRFNHILIDQRTHLFTSFLFVYSKSLEIKDYYKDPEFCMLMKRFLSINGNDQNYQIDCCFKKLISIHIQKRFNQLAEEYEKKRTDFVRKRFLIDEAERRRIDERVRYLFPRLSHFSSQCQNTEEFLKLTLESTACLHCDNYECGAYNFADAINAYCAAYKHESYVGRKLCRAKILALFKVLLVFNPDLINNRGYVGNGGRRIYFFLIYWLYSLRHFYSSSIVPSDWKQYLLNVELLLFIFQCLRKSSIQNDWARECLLDMCNLALSLETTDQWNPFVATMELELMKIVYHESNPNTFRNDEIFLEQFQSALVNLMKTKRSDLLSFIFTDENSTNDLTLSEQFGRSMLNVTTANKSSRRFFCEFLNQNQSIVRRLGKCWLFILLEKKENRLVKAMLRIEPKLIDTVDKDGNNLALYVCLHVMGCRHRIIQYLVDNGCKWERQNSKGEHFFQAIQEKKNRKLLEKLLEHECISIDPITEQYEMLMTGLIS